MSALTPDDREYINAQLPHLRAQGNGRQQTTDILAVAKELSSVAARNEWLAQAAQEFPGWD